MDKTQGNSKTIPAVKMKSGEEGIIAELDTDSKSILRKLMAMGILPGMKLKMIQTFPSYVFQVGYTQVAVDKEIASVILINKN
ncbi:ferrous iron transport protein A [Caloranaerobacter azorensis DSM 13643]|uniref:Ferrous iron transport protein A n=2 Tax=Caloranaerobacter azorensis TaxID=116090 RepID=A0A1M5VQD3_9FIRM|nr:FeoA family protein [Caloranaerobacter azorensis]SHH77466.1 ferrous iron transport protein A [Caloranaerobacter azorensis DSM 13643]